MRSLLAALALVTGIAVALLLPEQGPAAVATGSLLAVIACLLLTRVQSDKEFLLHVFVVGLLARVLVGSAIFSFGWQEFFGGDALTYDELGNALAEIWRGRMRAWAFEGQMGKFMVRDMGMPYAVGAIYFVTGRNMLAVQFASAVLGAATAPLIYFCAHHIFRNVRVARLSAIFVALFPSLVLWSSQGLKDGPVVFLLALAMLATLRLGERFSVKYVFILALSLFGIHSMRFYIIYMIAAAVGGALLIGKTPLSARTVTRQALIALLLGLSMTYMGVLRSATTQLEAFGNLDAVQQSRHDLARSADSGFGEDVDVSTTGGALSTIPLGLIYLLFAPFPWQLTNLRQSITLPEMLVWWFSFPMLAVGLWFTLKHRARQALPILIFTAMLTLAYSVVQGNVGTAYRQRSQLLVFYFIFASVGFVLARERREDRRRAAADARRDAAQRPRLHGARAPRTVPSHTPPLGNAVASGPNAGGDVHVGAAGGGGAAENWARATER